MPAISALSDVDHCNMALSHLSISQTIQSIDPPDKSVEAKTCAFWYPKVRDWLLQSGPWDFANVSQALASDASTYPGYGYAYQYPNDCLQAAAVTTAYGQRMGSAFWSGYWWPQSPMFGGMPKIPFKVAQSTTVPGEKAIFCDLPSPAYLFYIQGVTDTALFSPMFSDTFSLYLAVRVGGPLRANVQLIASIAQRAEGARLQTLAQMLNESQQDSERVSPSISVRW